MEVDDSALLFQQIKKQSYKIFDFQNHLNGYFMSIFLLFLIFKS